MAAGHLIAGLALAAALLLPGPVPAQGLKGPPPPQSEEPEEPPPPRGSGPAPSPEEAAPRAPQRAPPAPPARPAAARRLDLQVVRMAGDRPALTVQGPFAPGDADRFEQVLDANPGIREVLFNSPGGAVEDGLAIRPADPRPQARHQGAERRRMRQHLHHGLPGRRAAADRRQRQSIASTCSPPATQSCSTA
ncbi:hypothetical protein [Dankookia sp. P2]|uniref:hypothetical protein n=1 Tax=Dankookia sp. P2 TaxID=3423955 RepID=UPI003D66C292